MSQPLLLGTCEPPVAVIRRKRLSEVLKTHPIDAAGTELESLIDDDPGKPGAQPCLPAKFGYVGKGTHVGFLYRLLGVRLILKDGARDPPQSAIVLAHQRRECPGPADAQVSQQRSLLVWQRVRALFLSSKALDVLAGDMFPTICVVRAPRPPDVIARLKRCGSPWHLRWRWRKLHLAVDAGTGEIVAHALPDKDAGNIQQVTAPRERSPA